MTLSWLRPDLLFWLLAIPVAVMLPPLLLRRRLRLTTMRMALRTATLVLLIVALAGPLLVTRGATSTTIFLADRSGSVQTGSADAAREWMQAAIAGAEAGEDVLVSTFGGATQRQLGPLPASAVDDVPLRDDVGIDPDATDIQAALASAGAMPVGGARVVLLSDGAETTGMARAEIDRLRAADIPVDVVPLPGIPAGEPRITGMSGPAATWSGRGAQVTAYVASGDADATGHATADLLVDGDVAETQKLSLDGDATGVSFDLPELAPGFHVIETRLNPGNLPDPVSDNDTWPLGMYVREAPQVALVSPVGGTSDRLRDALRQQGFDVEAISSPALPGSASDLDAWDVIVLNNVPAWELDGGVQQALDDFAHNGGGVMVLGGTASYGPGAYAATTLESMLPVTVKVTNGRDRPRVAVLLVIDRSGSMSSGESTSGAPKIELAREGVVTAASALTTGDQVGVIAFNDEPAWALPMTTLGGGNPASLIASSIGELTPDGGTELFPALQVAIDGLGNVDTDVRHIVVLSDGRSRGAERDSYFRLLDTAAARGITVSTIGLGTDADTDLLSDLADAGGGRYHFVANASEIPRITFEEAKAAGSQSVLRGEFAPVQLAPNPIMTNIDPQAMPPLEGYNFAGARSGAQVVLASSRRDPLLVTWQYGLGRVLAWTSDSGADFAAPWASWDGYGRFWGNALSWVLPDPANQQYTVSATRSGDRAMVDIDSVGDVSPARAAATTVTVRNRQGEIVAGPVSLARAQQQLTVPVDSGSAWLIDIEDDTGTGHHAVTLAPGAEGQPSSGGDALLETIAGRTGGRVLGLDDDPAQVFATTAPGAGRQEATSIWWIPAALALALFVADIAVRLGVRLPVLSQGRGSP